MKMNTDWNWLLTKAEQEDGCMVSVGGLVTDLEGKTQTPTREKAEAEADRLNKIEQYVYGNRKEAQRG